jgi:hypothetical protein
MGTANDNRYRFGLTNGRGRLIVVLSGVSPLVLAADLGEYDTSTFVILVPHLDRCASSWSNTGNHNDAGREDFGQSIVGTL